MDRAARDPAVGAAPVELGRRGWSRDGRRGFQDHQIDVAAVDFGNEPAEIDLLGGRLAKTRNANMPSKKIEIDHLIAQHESEMTEKSGWRLGDRYSGAEQRER